MDFWFVITVQVIAVIYGLRLARYNLIEREKTKDARIAARRAYKKMKNERLKKMLGLDNIDNNK